MGRCYFLKVLTTSGQQRQGLGRQTVTIVALVTSVVLTTRASDAAPFFCEKPDVFVEETLNEGWTTGLVQACDDLARYETIDRDARVRAYLSNDELVLVVTTRDGRQAVRRVPDAEHLREALEALLVLPPELAARQEPADVPALVEQPADEPAPPPAKRIYPELGVGLSVRLANGPRFSTGPTAFAALHIDQWFLGASYRWDALQSNGPDNVDGYSSDSTMLALTAGRRWQHRAAEIDLGVEPRFIKQAQSFSVDGTTVRSTATDLFVGGFGRVSLGHGEIRPYVQADLESAPGRVFSDVRTFAQLAPLPVWSVGLALGVAWNGL